MVIPRLEIKRDEESSIGRGAVIMPAHFTPEMNRIWRAVMKGAKFFNENTDFDTYKIHTVKCTEGWRPARKDENGNPRRDLHTEFRALDFTFEYYNGKRIDPASVADKIFIYNLIDPYEDDYDFVAHGEGLNEHLHAEYDPK